MGVDAEMWMSIGRELTPEEIAGYNAKASAIWPKPDWAGPSPWRDGHILGRRDTDLSWGRVDNWEGGGDETVEGWAGEPVYRVHAGLLRYSSPDEPDNRKWAKRGVLKIRDSIKESFPTATVWYGSDSSMYGHLMTDDMVATLRRDSVEDES